ncbi:MAG: type II toxin-antitoxin system VapC family toxin [Acidobacteria bacterium]|nr:type II toxin-antitoxin system VapC family toxin [Acidobacteriota bacterium]
MKVLIDTHAALWFAEGSPRLSGEARSILENNRHELLFSVASLWEMAIKFSLNKLLFQGSFDNLLQLLLDRLRLNVLPISVEHTIATSSLPFHHRDPFDRMLAAQVLFERIPLLSADASFDAYGVERLW